MRKSILGLYDDSIALLIFSLQALLSRYIDNPPFKNLLFKLNSVKNIKRLSHNSYNLTALINYVINFHLSTLYK